MEWHSHKRASKCELLWRSSGVWIAFETTLTLVTGTGQLSHHNHCKLLTY